MVREQRSRRRVSQVKRWRNAFLGAGALALCSSGWGDEVPTLASPVAAVRSPTLNGILPADVPAGLTADDFSNLEGSWAEWASGTAQTVGLLFRDHDSLDALEVDLANAEIKLGTMEKALADSKYRSVHGLLADLHGRLRRRVDLARVILNAQQANVAANQDQKLNAALGKLRTAVATVEKDVSRYPNGKAWLPYVHADELKTVAEQGKTNIELLSAVKVNLAGRSTLAEESQRNFLHRDSFVSLERAIDHVVDASATVDPAQYTAEIQKIGAALFAAVEDYEVRGGELAAQAIRDQYNAWKAVAADGGAAMTAVLLKHYMNFNFRTVASEGFMKRVFETNRSEGSWVNDVIMEARVSGYQCTDSRLNVDIRPHVGSAEFCLMLEGNVRSNTQAFTSQATAHTVGNHRFHAEKAAYFDGHHFSSSGSTVSVSANNQPVSVDTNIRIPIIHGIANMIAMDKVREKMPQSNAITRQKIQSQVKPRLDKEVSENFDKASTNLEAKLYGPLRELESYPQDLDVYSTEDAILIRARLMEQVELGGNEWPDVAMPKDGVVIQTHESLLDNSIERAHFAGRELSQEQLKEELKARTEKLLHRKLDQKVENEEPTKTGDPKEDNAKFVFDEHDAIKFKVSNGVVRLYLRTGLKREGADPIPTQQIEVPLSFTVDGNDILIKREGTIAVRPVGPVTNRGEQVVRANVMRSNIQRLLPERRVKGTMTLESGDKKIPVKVTDIITRAGWVTIIAK